MPRWYSIRCGVWLIFGFGLVEVQGDSAAVRFHQPESRIQFEHPWPRPMVTTDGHNSAFYLTNARELQDVPANGITI